MKNTHSNTSKTTTATPTPAATAQSSPTPIGDLNLTDPPADRSNVAGLAGLRLLKALIVALIMAGRELASIEQAQGADFDTMITTKTMLSVGEARTLISFATRAGLTPEQLTAAVDVPLGRVLEALGLLGRIYLEQHVVADETEAREEGELDAADFDRIRVGDRQPN